MVLIMKRIFKLPLVCCLIFVSCTVVFGQKGKLRDADEQFALSHFMEASKDYETAFEKKATYRAAKGAAQSYERLAAYQNAHQWWTKAISFDEADSEDYARYASSLYSTGELKEVVARLQDPSIAKGLGTARTDSLKKWYSNPGKMELVGMGFNSSSADYGIAFDQEGSGYFSSDRGAVPSSGKKAIRVDGIKHFDRTKHDMTGRAFIKIYKGGENDQVVPVVSVVPGTYHFADPFFMRDKPIMFYTVSREVGKVKKKRNYTIHPEIYFSTVNEQGQLQDFNPFPYNSVLEHGAITPFVDEKEKRVYFSSNRAGGFGGYDLYYVTYDEAWNFGTPVNLGPEINTAGDERDPFLHDGVFYFASNGHIGLGGLDIFQAQYRAGSFSAVTNLGLPYNSSRDDFALRKKNGEVYLSSNRDNGKGSDDIYQLSELYRQFVARVVDCEGNLITRGLLVELSQKESKGLKQIATRQDDGGLILAEISPDEDYQIDLKKEGYFDLQDQSITTKGLNSDRLEKEYTLLKIPYKTIVSEDMIYYNFDDSGIRPDAQPIMLKMAELMKRFTFMEILVKSHTDSWASDEYNQALSERRANAVRDFLGDYGISRSRVRAEWYGRRQLVNNCAEGVPCPASAHQENRRSELIITAFPDEGKTYTYPGELEGLSISELEDLNLLIRCQ